jgi:HSP20 family protein
MRRDYYSGGAAGCGPAYGRTWRHHYGYHPFSHRAPVSIYKTDKSYELMVFAPGRVKENFRVQMKGDTLTISYHPAEDTSTLDWVRKEYSRGGFERSFIVDSSMDAEHISAAYINGVLTVSLPVLQNGEHTERGVKVD